MISTIPSFFLLIRAIFYILVKPAIVKIVLSEEQIWAGHPITARCETWGSSPAARIIWRLGEQVIGDLNVSTTQRSNSTMSKLSLVLTKDDDGKELICRAENPRFPGGVLEEVKTLYVACKCIRQYNFIYPSLFINEDIRSTREEFNIETLLRILNCHRNIILIYSFLKSYVIWVYAWRRILVFR